MNNPGCPLSLIDGLGHHGHGEVMSEADEGIFT